MQAAGKDARFRVEVLSDRHRRDAFSSEVSALDRYLTAQVGQDVRRRIASCFVLVAGDDPAVLGYYTLAATGLLLSDLPESVAKKLPRYPLVPAILIGRLAVDGTLRGQGWGRFLLLDALGRALRSEIASFAVVVDAKDDAAREFYLRYGFRLLPRDGRRLFLPMVQIAKALS